MRACLVALLLSVTVLAQADQSPTTTFEGSPAVVLSNDRLALTVLVKGGTMASMVLADDPDKLNPFWNPVRMNRELGRDAPASSSAGHFLCVDGFGQTSAEERAAGLPTHGEAHVTPHTVRSGRAGKTSEMVLTATLPLVQETVTRTIRLVDGEQVLYVDTELTNLLGFDRPVNWGEHATVGSPFLEPGVTVFDMSGTRARTRDYQQPTAPNDPRTLRRLASGQEFTWPMAPGLDRTQVDVSRTPTDPHFLDHMTTLVSPTSPYGWTTALNPARKLIVGYLFRREDYPWIQTWGSYPPTGKLARGMEFATQPYDVPRREIITAGPMFGTPTFRWLPAKSRIESRFLMFYAHVPDGFTKVDDVRLEGGRIVVEDRRANTRITLAASRGLDLPPAATAQPAAAQPAVATAGFLAGLELAADKTDIERFKIAFDTPFSPSTLDYTATVDASYTSYVLITPSLPPGSTGSLKVNGTDTKAGEPVKVALAVGSNPITVTVTPGGSSAATTYRLTVVQKDLSGEYRSESLGKGVWRIQDFGGFISNEDMYLFEGKDRALLFDTGMGRGDLAAYVKTLTKLPVDVAISHGNRDHFLQVDRFPDATVYLSAKDVTRLPPSLVTPKYKWIKDGDVIDIGAGRRFSVAEVPGHSLGSVLYIDDENKVAITGDAISSGSMVYVFAPTCTALDEYLESLKKLETRVSKLDGLTLLVGHHYQERTPLTGQAGKQLITDMRIAAEKVLRGELTGTPARTVRDGKATELRQLNVGLAGLWYNPANLVTAPGALGFLDVRTATGAPVIPNPIFSSFQRTYAASVPGSVTRVEIVPTAYRATHRGITINGRPARSGAAFAADLATGENRFEITVTSDTGAAVTYTVVISRSATR